MKFNPGRSLGNPLSPRCLPYLLIRAIAAFNCLESQLSQFASCTLGSADSNPKERTAPSDKVSTRVLVISSDGSKFSAIIEGFPLSVCRISSLSSSLSPCSNLAIGSGFGIGYSNSFTPSAMYVYVSVIPPKRTCLTPISWAILTSWIISSGVRQIGTPFFGSIQNLHPLLYLTHPW